MITGDIPTEQMTLADAYAGIAPDVPEWFTIEPSPRPQKPEVPAGLPEELGRECKQLLTADNRSEFGTNWPKKLKPTAEAFAFAVSEYIVACRLAMETHKIKRIVQWRWRYAREMVAARETA